LQFGMRVTGPYTRAASQLAVGDAVSVRGPFGSFTLDESAGPVVFLAGGIGITPFMSLAASAAEAKLVRAITLLYSSRNQADIPFADDLAALEQANTNFRSAFLVSDGGVSPVAGRRIGSGRITAEIIDRVVGGNFGAATYYLCGPPAFMDSLSKMLEAKGVSPHRIMTESFAQSPQKATGGWFAGSRPVYISAAAALGLFGLVVAASDLDLTADQITAAQAANSAPISSTSTPTPTPTLTPTPAATTSPGVTVAPTPTPVATVAPTPRPTVIYTPPTSVPSR
jgi:ferredoxin-NADP reductase